MYKIVLCLFFLIGFRGYSQEVSATLTPNNILLGDHLTLELKANNATSSLMFPAINDTSMGNFRLVEELKTDTLYSGNHTSILKKYIITCFEDSVQTFPALTFYNGVSGTYMTQAIKIQVNGINIDSAKDVKPIKGIIQVPLTKKEIFSYLFISFILLGLVILLYLIYVKWIRKEELFDREKPEDPPHVVALKSLKDIETAQLWQKGQVKEYYDRVSDTIRTYLEKRFGIKALEQTTSQIINTINQLELPETLYNNIVEILNLADLAKFAKENPDKTANESILKHSYSFIQNTQMSYDANKKANALQVRKFYAQNKYLYKSVAINQDSFKILIYGLMSSLLLLSLIIAISYLVPVPYLLGLIANSPIVFFIGIIACGILITLIVLTWIRNRMLHKMVLFDYDSLILKSTQNQSSILFSALTSYSINAKKDLVIEDNAHNKYIISKKYEYFSEIVERIKDIIDIEQQKNIVKE